MSKIRVLSKELANQIAAGEVIERPASVVKELVENALDAKACKLHIEIIEAGIRLIRVSDNGCGIEKDDLELSIFPHATSKIQSVDELFSVKTLGFRGEALASIASVSKFQLCSKAETADEAYSLKAEGSEIQSILKTAHPVGTTISVEDLFFNTLSRRRFLRSEKTEQMHIEAIVKRLAMTRFDLELSLTIDGKKVLHLMPAISEAQQKKRVLKLFGQSFMKEAMSFSAAAGGFKLSGFLGHPNYLRSQNDLQYCFVNGRVVRDKLLMHAILEAYGPLLYPGRQATFLLFFTLPATEVDVNVHPTKHEVRFYEPRQVHDFFSSVLKRHLSAVSAPKEALMPESTLKQPQKFERAQAPVSFSSRMSQTSSAESLAFLKMANESQVIALQAPFVLLNKGCESAIFNLEKCYQHWLKKMLQEAFANGPIVTRPLLVPMRFKCSEKTLSLSLASFRRCGLQIEPLSEEEYVLRAFPSLTPYLSFKPFLKRLSELRTEQALLDAYVEHSLVSWQTLGDEERRQLEEFFSNTEVNKPFGQRLTRQSLETLLCP
jgi:DNA mismatch repair protein MutL